MAELGFAEPIDPDRPLNEIGLDSLRSVTLANNLEDEFGILVSISELISGPTINQLSDYLSDLLALHPKDEAAEFRSSMLPVAAIRTLATNAPVAVAHADSCEGPTAHEIPHLLASEAEIAGDGVPGSAGLQFTNACAPDTTALDFAENGQRKRRAALF